MRLKTRLQAKKFRVAVIDEACQSTELETLLVWAHNTETMLLLIFLGDPKQLRATVKTHGRNTDDQLMNPFSEQLIISFFERLWTRGFDMYMLTEQYRLAAGLEEVFSELFYDAWLRPSSLPCQLKCSLTRRIRLSDLLALVMRTIQCGKRTVRLSLRGRAKTAGRDGNEECFVNL